MARRRESVFDILLILPWWVGLASGAVGYVAVTYVLPRLWTDQLLGAVAKGIQPIGTVWLVLCVVAAIGSAVRSIFIARKYDRLKSAEDVRSLSWRQFESIVGEAFRRRGYTVLENAVDGPDGGVDLVLRRNGEKFYVQCKQWKKSSVGVKPIREFFGVISASEAAGGFFVCSGSYTGIKTRVGDNRVDSGRCRIHRFSEAVRAAGRRVVPLFLPIT
jgi:restriction system protein